MSDAQERIPVVLTIDFRDEVIQRLQAISPRLEFQKFTNKVPEKAWKEAEILYTGQVFPEPEQAPRLRWIQLHSAGMDHALAQRIVQAEDMLVTSTSGIHMQQIAQYCIMMMLAFNFRLPRMLDYQRKAEWPKTRFEEFRPVEIQHQTVGLVGYGSIAREVARLASLMGMTVLASKRNIKRSAENQADYTPSGTGDPEGTIPDRLYPSEAVATMAKECDYLVVTVPSTQATHRMIDERVFKMMKKTGVLINIARGEVVDEKALIAALKSGEIGGAALDVFEQEPLPADSPLWKLDNVIISPHVSGNSTHYNDKAATLFAANLERYLENRPLYNALNREIGY